MSAIPQPEHTTAKAVYAVHEAGRRAESMRPYLGWSEIGAPCDRQLWYRWRWCERDAPEGRMLRLFDTGHREEARLLTELKQAGMEVWERNPETDEQFAVSSLGGHFRGHLDAIVRGLPEAPKTAHVFDVKTIKSKKMDELEKKGMAALYPEYVAQGQGYMGKMELERAAFAFVCKDDERIRLERFDFDKKEFERYEQRAARIIASPEPPLRISEDPAWFECRYCAFHALCHDTTMPLVNCRTCTHSTPVVDDSEAGAWRCEKLDKSLSLKAQEKACGGHRFIPIFLENFAEPIDAQGDDVLYAMKDGGTRFFNGEPPAGYASEEIRAAHDKRILVDTEALKLREQFPGSRVVA